MFCYDRSMSSACKLYLVRHGESVANVHSISGGNSALTERGEAQARETKELFTGIHFDAVYSSDLVRAVKTVEIISGKLVPEENLRTELRERNFGSLEDKPGATWFEIMRAYEYTYGALPFKQRIEHEYADGIEGDKAICTRVFASLKAIAELHPGETILVGTHAGPIRDVLMYLGFAQLLTADSFKNAGYIELIYTDSKFEVRHVVGMSVPEST